MSIINIKILHTQTFTLALYFYCNGLLYLLIWTLQTFNSYFIQLWQGQAEREVTSNICWHRTRRPSGEHTHYTNWPDRINSIVAQLTIILTHFSTVWLIMNKLSVQWMKTISPTGHYLAEKGCKYQQEITLLTLPLTVQSDPAGGIINQFILGSHHKKRPGRES